MTRIHNERARRFQNMTRRDAAKKRVIFHLENRNEQLASDLASAQSAIFPGWVHRTACSVGSSIGSMASAIPGASYVSSAWSQLGGGKHTSSSDMSTSTLSAPEAQTDAKQKVKSAWRDVSKAREAQRSSSTGAKSKAPGTFSRTWTIEAIHDSEKPTAVLSSDPKDKWSLSSKIGSTLRSQLPSAAPYSQLLTFG